MTDSNRAQQFLRETPRRMFLKAATAAAALAGISGTATVQEGEQTFEFNGHIGAWQGMSPAEIEDKDNPTLELEPGETYIVEWTNVDGLPHNFVIIDDQGDEVVRSVPIEEQGATQTVEFEATEEMAVYLCEFHPETMRGDLVVGGEAPPEEAARDLDIPEGDRIGLETVADELASPLALEVAEGDNRRFVVDQPGQVYVLSEDGLEEEPFLDIADRIVDLGVEDLGGYDERGLLGLAFHPEFAENGRLFVRYSAPLEEGQREFVGPPDRWASLDENDWSFDDFDHVEVLSEFGVDDEGNADPDSEEILLEMPSPQMNHDAGAVAFGPDGYLYFGMGDGGDRDDTGMGHVEDWYDGNEGGNGQDTEDNLLGSLLRIDVDAEGDEDRPYGIPDENPLVDREGHFDELYAWGFRNPYTLSFDSDGRLFVADAGQNLWEEVNLVENGGNYGWNVKEGTHCFSTENPVEIPDSCPDSTPEDVRGGEPLVDPVIEYRHRESTQAMIDGSVVIGGFVYEGTAIEQLQDRYVFGNWSGSGVRDPNGELFVATPREEAEAVEETPTPTPEEETPTPTPEEETPTPTPTPEETPTPTPTPEATPSPTPEGTPANETATPTPTATPEGTPDEIEAETIELGGETGGWQGRAPAEIEGETNPTLTLEPGTTYVVEWENLDGAPHNFVIEDADGNHLVETEVMSEQGATQTVEFEATEAMAEYYCEVHPTSMRGDVERSGGESASHMSHKSDELWPIEKLVIEGREDGELDEYVYALGRDADDELYVLTSEIPLPTGTTGKVHRIVPPGEGETADEGDEADGEGGETDGADETGDGTDY